MEGSRMLEDTRVSHTVISCGINLNHAVTNSISGWITSPPAPIPRLCCTHGTRCISSPCSKHLESIFPPDLFQCQNDALALCFETARSWCNGSIREAINIVCVITTAANYITPQTKIGIDYRVTMLMMIVCVIIIMIMIKVVIVMVLIMIQMMATMI